MYVYLQKGIERQLISIAVLNRSISSSHQKMCMNSNPALLSPTSASGSEVGRPNLFTNRLL